MTLLVFTLGCRLQRNQKFTTGPNSDLTAEPDRSHGSVTALESEGHALVEKALQGDCREVLGAGVLGDRGRFRMPAPQVHDAAPLVTLRRLRRCLSASARLISLWPIPAALESPL